MAAVPRLTAGPMAAARADASRARAGSTSVVPARARASIAGESREVAALRRRGVGLGVALRARTRAAPDTTRVSASRDGGDAGASRGSQHKLVEGPRGEVFASSDDAIDDALDAWSGAMGPQTGSGGYGSRRTSRKKKGRSANKSAAAAQGTRGASSISYDSFDEGWDGAQAFARGRVGVASDPVASRDDALSRAGDWGDQAELRAATRQLERAADRGDAESALTALRRLRKAAAEGPQASASGTVPLAFYNSALRACKRSRPPAHVEARRLLLEMRDGGPAPDARTYHEVIAALARAHEWRLAERTFAEMKRAFPNHDPSVLVYTSLISAYGKGGQWEKAKGAFDALREAGTRVDTGVYNALLSAAVSAAEYREAARVFDRMPSEGVRRNVTTYNAVLTSLGRQRRLRDMETLRREMRKGGIEANETTFSVLITAHGNTGDCHRACKLLDEACDAPWVYKSAVVFNSALGACVKNGESRLAQRVLRLMRAEGIQPTLVTYNTMLMGASAERDWKGVTDTFRELLQSGQAPDAITLDCMCGIEKLQAAADARAEAEAAAARAVGADGDAEGADAEGADAEGADEAPARGAPAANLDELCDLLRVVVDEEIVRNAGGGVVNGNAADDRMGASSAASRRGTYKGAGLPPPPPGASTTHAYDALLRALHASGRGADVESTYREMLDSNVRRTVHTYNSLIASYEARRQWQRAGDAMARMQEEGITPDAITFDALIDVTEEMGQWDRATAWLEQAQEQGHLRCEDELGVLDLHRIRSAGTAQTVLRWWLRRMRSRALAPLDAAAAGRGTRAILDKASGAAVSTAPMPVQIRDLPPQIQVVTGWGKHSTVFGHSPVKERVVALLGGLNSPFDVPDHNIGCVVAERGEVRAWLVRDELLSLVRFLGGNKEALRRNFNPKSAGLKANDPTEQ